MDREVDWSRVETAVPAGPARAGRLRMAGFRFDRSPAVVLDLIPHPDVTILLDLTDDGFAVTSDGRKVMGNAAVGLGPGVVRAAGHGSGEVMELRIAPVDAAAVLGDPAAVGATLSPLDARWDRLVERLRGLASWEERFALATGFVRDCVERRTEVPEVAWVWDQTVRRNGLVRIDALASDVGWSRQRLWSRFRDATGVSPKRAAELARFDHAAHLLAAGAAPASVAVAAGYADQSHLHREARALAHRTPAAVARAPWLAIDTVAWPRLRPPRTP